MLPLSSSRSSPGGPSPTRPTRAPEGSTSLSNRQAIEAALEAWRQAQRDLEAARDDADLEGLAVEVEQRHSAFQRLAAAHMAEHLDALRFGRLVH